MGKFELTAEEFEVVYASIRSVTEVFEPDEVGSIIRTQRRARWILEDVRARAGLEPNPPKFSRARYENG